MQRRPWFEVHDSRYFPRFLRHLVTDALEAMWNRRDLYGPVVPLLEKALHEAGTNLVVDLCSGGGGPWQSLMRSFTRKGAAGPHVYLTDLHPNRRAFERLSKETGVKFRSEPIDAMRIPNELKGFRTIFSSFHHFAPDQARAILRDAWKGRQGIGVFEMATREPRTLAAVFLVPLLALLTAPSIRPFRWSRLIFTYALPVIPFTLWIDGLLSCLRSYSVNDFEELIEEMKSEDYRWEIGTVRERRVSVAYLIGNPLRIADCMPEEMLAATLAEIEKPA